jgi:acyl carrier protein
LDGAARRTAIAGSGRPLADVTIAIVDPETGRHQPADRVGEIWLGGPTIARGYWRRPEESAATFGVRIAGEDDPIGYLRTGDLGAMIDGELCVTGRIKDLIILSGANHYPQDIERAAQAAHPALRADSGAAFSIAGDHGAEQVVLVQELERTQRRTDPEPVFSAISTAVWQMLELQVSRIVLVEPGAVLRTSSGKIQRAANRQAWRDGALPVIADWRVARQAVPETTRSPPPGDAAALQRWLCEWLSRRLELPLADVRVDRGVGELGLTSVDAVELAGALGAHLGRKLPQTLAFDHPTISAMVAHLCKPPTAPAAPPPPSPPPGSGGDLEELLSMIEGDGRGDH